MLFFQISALFQVEKIFPLQPGALSICQKQFLKHVFFGASQEEVESVIATLHGRHLDNPRLFKKVVLDSGTENLISLERKVHESVFTETGGVVISDCLSITKTFEDWITRENGLTNVTNFSTLATHLTKISQEVHRDLS